MKQKILKELDGCEVSSLICEGTVGITNGEVRQNGEKLNLTNEEIKELRDEYLEGEGISAEYGMRY